MWAYAIEISNPLTTVFLTKKNDGKNPYKKKSIDKSTESYCYMNGEGNSVLGQSNLAAIGDGNVTLYQLSNSPLV